MARPNKQLSDAVDRLSDDLHATRDHISQLRNALASDSELLDRMNDEAKKGAYQGIRHRGERAGGVLRHPFGCCDIARRQLSSSGRLCFGRSGRCFETTGHVGKVRQ